MLIPPICARALLLAGMLALASPVLAQSGLTDLSIEDLMKLDAGQVYGASERLQPVMEAPSSVSFITAAEIERYGYRTLADILRSVRGFYVSDDRNFSLVGVRGFAKPGDYNSRILLLVNGHRVNDTVFGQAEIGAEFGWDPAIFERVEIIRGPASSLYGDSAFFAVVNVITRSGASLSGGTLSVEAGTLGTALVRASAGQRLNNGVDFALSSTFERSSGVERLYFPAYDSPETNNGIAENLDGENIKQLYGHFSLGGLTVTGAYGTRFREVPTASFQTVFNSQDPIEQTTDRHTLVDADYGHNFKELRLTLRASYDRFSYTGIYPFLTDTPGVVNEGRNDVVGARWTFGSGVTRALPGRQTMRGGAEFIANTRQDQSGVFSDPTFPTLDLQKSSNQGALYITDEVKLSRSVIFNGGLRYDIYGDFQRLSPRAALIVLPSAAQSVKYMYGSAFRAPNQYELNSFYFGDQVNSLRPESIDTHELVYERYINDWLRTSVSTYWYNAEGLITNITDPGTLLGQTFINAGQVRAKGLELEAQMRVFRGSRALVSYALQNAVDQGTGEDLPNSPRHMLKGRIGLPGFTPGSSLSVEGQYLSRRGTLDGTTVDPYTTFNVTYLQPLGRSWEIYGTIRNFFDDDYADPGGSQHVQDAIPQNGRTARIGLRWKLWNK